jgi:hypothetical protein
LLSVNQTNLSVVNLPLNTPWQPGQALWLIWSINDATGSGQGYGIDNLGFSASNAKLATTQPVLTGITYTTTGGIGENGLSFSFTNTPGADFSVYSATNLTPPVSWTFVGNPTETSEGSYSLYQFLDQQATNKPQRFYKVTSP